MATTTGKISAGRKVKFLKRMLAKAETARLKEIQANGKESDKVVEGIAILKEIIQEYKNLEYTGTLSGQIPANVPGLFDS